MLLLRAVGWSFVLAIILALLGGISLGLIYGYRTLTSSTHFAVSHVDVNGNRQLSTVEILNLSGVGVGMNILEVSLGEMSRKLQNNPWIESVTVRRTLPDGLVINIVEREPFFWIQRGSALYYADRNGVPIVALEIGKFVSLPALIIEEGIEPNWRLMDEWVRAVERLEFPFSFSEVAWLKIEDANIVRLYLEDRGMVAHFDLSGWREHRGIMNRVWEDLTARGELQNTARLTVMSGKAWVQLRQP
ncbi:cell division protein FtsQ/DivIB [Desulfonatronum thiosulfatophilum]|uniref:cell division protein FtsQ/DivIB n=1 Tax=Desulfonatronum thiosulfatophilum TaxID=617002 RepID=UPI00137A7F08|nr:FtsQ-type POTRA domain-containing protein [Desulfonatronum thiosulfatophilum]